MQNVLKQVGASGQFAIGKQFAGKYFELNTRPDGVIELTPRNPRAVGPDGSPRI